MFLKRLIIENFRSYYGRKSFVFGPKLNLILGSNGDGKSTLFEALKWVLTPKETDTIKLPKLDSLVSEKMFNELSSKERPRLVRVVLECSQSESGKSKKLVRQFFVGKSDDGQKIITQHSFKAYSVIGGKEKDYITVDDLLEKEGLFPVKIKEFCIHQGEESLDVFDSKSQVLSNIVDMYSEVKDLDPFKVLSDMILENGKRARQNTIDKKTINSSSVKRLQNDIDELVSKEKKLDRELEEKRIFCNEAEKKIEEYKADRETIKLINKKTEEISGIERLIEDKRSRLDEDYSIRLLDNLWILCGFEDFTQEYMNKMESFEERISTIRSEHNRKVNEIYNQRKVLQDAKNKLKETIDAMPGFMPEIESMREMLRVHKCKYCGTEAPEGSAPYEHIKHLLSEYERRLKESLEEIHIPDIPPLELGGNVKELANDSRVLSRMMANRNIESEIYKTLSEQEEIYESIKKAEASIERLNEEIIRLTATSNSGKDLKKFIGKGGQDAENLYVERTRAEDKIGNIKVLLKEVRDELKVKRDKYDSIIRTDKNRQFMDVYDMALCLSRSLDALEEKTYGAFMRDISERANKYMDSINVDDFHGKVSMEKNYRTGKIDVLLRDNRGEEITNPNKSLYTTKNISMILALSDFNKSKRNNTEYPIILDAPTSSFDTSKEMSFYQSISNLDSQCLIITKSFIYKNESTGEMEIDMEKLKDIDCPIYRIKKNSEGFDQKDLSTIDTIVEPVKNISI